MSYILLLNLVNYNRFIYCGNIEKKIKVLCRNPLKPSINRNIYRFMELLSYLEEPKVLFNSDKFTNLKAP